MSKAFKNSTELEFTDISNELYRTYTFFENQDITIKQPLRLHVSESGGHRVFDSSGISHYIPAGWIHLKWEVSEGSPNFVK